MQPCVNQDKNHLGTIQLKRGFLIFELQMEATLRESKEANVRSMSIRVHQF